MENITITTQLANAIVQYLATKPYAEVANLIAELQKQATPPATQEPQQ